MNALIFFCLAAAAATCSGAQYVGYPAFGFFSNLGSAPVAYNSVPYSLPPVSYNVAPVAPLAPVAPVAPVQSQYHAQDELGQYSFGYFGGPSSRAETRDAFGVVRGSYNYVDSEGKLQTQHYVADALGFRVSGTNLPVAPSAAEAPALVGPEPVQDTEEVAAAKAVFKKAFDEAAAAAEAAPDTRKRRSIVTPADTFPIAPLHFSYSFSTPLAYPHPLAYSPAFPAVPAYTGIPAATTYAAATPASVRDATLLRVVHNPGHAVSYRVD